MINRKQTVNYLGSVELSPSSNFEKKFAEDLRREIQEYQERENEACRKVGIVLWYIR
jgi:hypothetical protein